MICVIKIALNICQTLIKHKRFGFSGMLSITSSQAASHHYPPENGSVCTERSSLTPRSRSTCTHVHAQHPHLPSASVGVHFDATPRPRSDWRRSASPLRLRRGDPLHSARRPQGGGIWLVPLRRARMRALVCICLCVNEHVRPRRPLVVHQS